jgi:hypothetical protein
MIYLLELVTYTPIFISILIMAAYLAAEVYHD